MDKLPEAIIAVAGAILAAVITTFKDEIVLLFRGRLGADRDIEGRWACAWQSRELDDPGNPVTEITDVVKIERVSGEKVKAIGENSRAGPYKLTGRLMRSSVLTFSWSGDGERQFLGGVAVLELNTKRTRMTGYWCEVTEDRGFIGGKVTWTKQS